MADPFRGGSSLRPAWRVLLFYVAVSAAYRLERWVLPAAASRLARAALLLAALLAVTRLFLALEARPLRAVGLAPGWAFLRQFGSGVLAGGAIILASALAAYAGGGFRPVRAPAAGAGMLASATLLYLLIALNEELTFRGYLFQRIEWPLGSRGALLLTALLFAAAHLANPGMDGVLRFRGTLTILAAGLLLGLAYLGTRSLALPIGLHLGWNWTQGALLGFGVSGTASGGLLAPVLDGRKAWLTGGAFGLEGGLPCLIVCLLACLILVRFRPPLSSKSESK